MWPKDTFVSVTESYDFSNVSSDGLPGMMHIYTGYICLVFLRCVSLNVSSNYLQKRMQIHIYYICVTFLCCVSHLCVFSKYLHRGCTCSTFLHCVFSNESSNCLPQRMKTHIGCICLICLHCAFLNVPLKNMTENIQSCIGCIYMAFLQCVFFK